MARRFLEGYRSWRHGRAAGARETSSGARGAHPAVRPNDGGGGGGGSPRARGGKGGHGSGAAGHASGDGARGGGGGGGGGSASWFRTALTRALLTSATLAALLALAASCLGVFYATPVQWAMSC